MVGWQNYRISSFLGNKKGHSNNSNENSGRGSNSHDDNAPHTTVNDAIQDDMELDYLEGMGSNSSYNIAGAVNLDAVGDSSGTDNHNGLSMASDASNKLHPKHFLTHHDSTNNMKLVNGSMFEGTKILDIESNSESDATDEAWIIEKNNDIPDGGFDAWLVVFGSFLGLVPVYGLFNSLGALESYINKNQLVNEELSTTSWIFSIFLAVSCFSTILTGGYFDRNGSVVPYISGTILFLSGLIATANCTKVWHFVLAFSLTTALGSGMLITPLVGCVATWFLKKRGIASCLATIGGSVGGVIFPIMLRKLYVEVGFIWAIRIFALVCGACLTASAFLAKERGKEDAEPFNSRKEMISWYLTSSLNWRYFLEPKFLFTALASALAESSLTASSTYLTSYSIFKGNSENTAYTMSAVLNAVGILGRYIPGYLADKYVGRFNIAVITITASALVNLIIWLPFGGHSNALWAYIIIYGFFSGSVLSLAPPCVGQISLTNDFGKRFSTVFFTEGLVTIPIIPICGAIIGQATDKSYNNFIIFTSMLMLAAAALYFMARYSVVGFKFIKF
ncbi:hypothetical protein TPHA_0J01680 [Tetrapisispora phaffii CBS 4417]|uniref:Major facilitator superfamily (MFS) profile domain-containing protein n=1 Tax=Tetrapisispora phaffii (strain ATCC 24235 / CBS 4417 / NBRC 1672 / NRRL Y-8282 / UCD 70-5) TaxID=1071381 RepID=G8BYP7_TETPH|nr:hypothetical protein TPHA_0J01680 [Tetrapisispora phaffii CBS 4417]CCE64989.1 hypothetical protein TPHA_0J01680 [Tetrapisispora phaffii CBS 4417]